MTPAANNRTTSTKKPPGVFSLLRPYTALVVLLILFALLGNALNLLLPKIIANGIDTFEHHQFSFSFIIKQFLLATVLVFVFTYLQTIIQTYTSEKVARDLRSRLADKISHLSYAALEQANPSKLLTNLTADVDSIKLFVSQAVVSIASSLFIIVGASILLLTINWKLALCVMAIIPIIGITFFVVLKKVRALFIKGREVIDRLNKVISESILGAALIRVVNSQQLEYDKFIEVNNQAKTLGLSILRLFAGLIPVIVFTANMAGLAILLLGGHYVITGSMSLGNFAAFNSYLAMLIFPILVIGFMSNVIAQATASYQRISFVLNSPDPIAGGTITSNLQGDIQLKKVSLFYGQKPTLKNIDLHIKPGSRIAVIGPTAAGKTQLLYLLTGLVKATAGVIEFDGHRIEEYNKENFYSQVGFVFQDSIVFNMSIRENIAFSDTVTDASLQKAIDTAELGDFIKSLPNGLNTVVSERGSSLSGGQKQRIMLARALAIDPRILLLDDFTARVDQSTETKILQNVLTNYSGITLISVTQKIAAIEQYDQIILLTQGEIVASGKHEELMNTSVDYVQILNSQQSTSNYESVSLA
ncbi:ABC transporter ATP-binding protein [Segetibacter aerophilus]|uniref:ABC transporter ATP-binding protein n=1 Tax=Segetibacter aerophilus TaxID=670293 RepID=A0A512BCT8_9BACT|nr:ABC transporter ATP-binding protein [Segetibacter aerophilus]GEO09677.1 ABC transporter ATP-binding protein [Segetibacter aerophilus]